MTLYQFNTLDETEQIEAIWKQGVLQATRTEDQMEYYLYQIDSFYIEMKCFQGTDNIIAVKTFRTTELLTPYLQHINIERLIK